MRLAVITPVGPGHEHASLECAISVHAAAAHSPGPFRLIRHEEKDDTHGELGRSRARNMAVAANPGADWFFFLDADDLAIPEAFARFGKAVRNEPDLSAVFGAVCIGWPRENGKPPRAEVVAENVYPLDWDGLLRHGPAGTLSMGCFVRGDAARETPFKESMDAGEDFEFYLRLLHGRRWTKLADPLVMIRRTVPSATGPRGYATLDWRGKCQDVIDRWKADRPTAR